MGKFPKKIIVKMYGNLRRLEEILNQEDFGSFIQADSWIIQDAVIRRLINISYISEFLLENHNNFCDAHPGIPFKELSGMKKYLTKIQDGNVDLALIWQTLQKIIPELIDKIEDICKKSR